MMEATPRAAFEVIEPQLFLELWMGLLTRPACFDGAGQGFQRRSRWVIREVVFDLPGGAFFSDQPSFVSGKMYTLGGFGAIGGPNANGVPLCMKRPFGPVTPRDATPAFRREACDEFLGTAPNMGRQRPFAGAPHRSRARQSSAGVDRIELLFRANAHGPSQ